MRDFVIGWRLWGNAKKQHLFILSHEGDPVMHCYKVNHQALEDNEPAVFLEHSDLKINRSLPKCKRCLKEASRLNRLGYKWKPEELS